MSADRKPSRFECVMEPCGHYTVWDRQAELPVVVGTRILSFVDADEAQRAIICLTKGAADDER